MKHNGYFFLSLLTEFYRINKIKWAVESVYFNLRIVVDFEGSLPSVSDSQRAFGYIKLTNVREFVFCSHISKHCQYFDTCVKKKILIKIGTFQYKNFTKHAFN